MERALEESKTLEKLTLDDIEPLPKEFCRHLMFGTKQNTSLSEMYLNLNHRAGIASMMVGWCMPVTSCVTQLDVVYSV